MVRLSEELITLDPRDTATEQRQRIAPRLADLNGKVVGLLSNNKHNSEELLRMVADMMGERYSIKGVIEANKGNAGIPAPPEMIEDLVSRCDVVIAATAE